VVDVVAAVIVVVKTVIVVVKTEVVAVVTAVAKEQVEKASDAAITSTSHDRPEVSFKLARVL